ncbi:MAG: MopE-related protein [Myxococcota bacterium]|nr:MopE-related protein [Myxococcota bacterium]
MTRIHQSSTPDSPSVPNRYTRIFVLLALMSMAWVGCGEGGETGQSFRGAMCTENLDCKLGFVCEQARCQRLDLVDEDGDGVSDSDERRLGTSPTRADSDGDGLSDAEELNYDETTRTFSAPDSDDDGTIDARESSESDRDNDGIVDAEDPCDRDPDCPTPRPEPAACLMEEGEPCVVGIGSCRRVGATVCTDDMMGTECVGEPGLPSPEICDEKDNDCDGLVDNDIDVSSDIENCGACGNLCEISQNTAATCVDGTCRLSCLPNTYNFDDAPDCEYECTFSDPPVETCNGIDDDCDGRIDESDSDPAMDNEGESVPLTQACGTDEGQCEQGIQTCIDGTFGACVGGVVPTDEVCDQLDNDCDGVADNGFDLDNDQRHCGACGIVCPTPNNTTSQCLAGQCQTRCLPNTYDYDDEPGCEYECVVDSPEVEACNGLDDDCDGRIDEDFNLATDLSNCGRCGTRCPIPTNTSNQCVAGQCSTACLPYTYDYDDEPGCEYECEPSDTASEVCNGADDDCDGQIDEDFVGVGGVCSIGDGACISRGVLVCADDEDGLVCNAPVKDGGPERCDGIDNDCDDNIDEDFVLGDVCEVGVGACRQPGTIRCSPVTGAPACDGIVLPATQEVCDDIDNDCDGFTDEDQAFRNKGEPCEVGLGECSATGQFVCSADRRSTVCVVDGIDGSGELCNGQDDDCDGETDEAFQLGMACVRGEGQCARDGTTVCAADGRSVICDAVVPPGEVERCDGIDNDCDLNVDEEFQTKGNPCTLGLGQCQAEGRLVCTANGQGVVCDALVGSEVPERCDTLDNDCDGRVDESFSNLGERCSVGQGLCTQNGRIVCAENAQSAVCSASPRAPEVELCNERDDDCDGETDEAFNDLDQVCSVGTGVCRRTGAIECRADFLGAECNVTAGVPDGPEQCNETDDDCDGETDEDFSPACDLIGTQVSAGSFESCALTTKGEVRCWGDSKASPPAQRFTVLSGGNNFHCGKTVAGEIRCWGNFELSEGGDFDEIAAGTSPHICVLARETGLPICWGQEGQVDARVLMPPAIPMRAISSGENFSCGLRRDNGEAICWGTNVRDALTAPVGIAYQAIDSGANHTCAIRDNLERRIDCWGLNLAGMLNVPAGEYAQVSVGDSTACAVKTDGTMSCWGRGRENERNQFGQAIAPDGIYSGVSVGGYHACAVRSDTSVIECWGAGKLPYENDNLIHWGQSTPPR